MSVRIIRNQEYIPHQAIVFTQQKNIKDFSLTKVAVAYAMRKKYIGEEKAIWEIEFHPTNNCNLQCDGCSYRTRHNRNTLSIKQISDFLDHYKYYDLRNVFFSGGGDPLVWKYWREFFFSIHKTCKYGIATNLFNFSAIKDYWEMFDFYQIHLTGYDPKSCYKTTGVDSFRYFNDNISFLLSHKLPYQNIVLKVLVNKALR